MDWLVRVVKGKKVKQKWQGEIRWACTAFKAKDCGWKCDNFDAERVTIADDSVAPRQARPDLLVVCARQPNAVTNLLLSGQVADPELLEVHGDLVGEEEEEEGGEAGVDGEVQAS